MKKSTVRKVEDILRDYPKIDRYIEKLEQKARYAAETTTITIDENKALNAFKKQRDIIDDCLNECSKDTEKIIKELYFKRYPQFTLNGIVENHIVSVGHNKAYQLRNNFIEDVAKGMGLYDL
ncbi:transcriptional regulator [Liquorilactobacillus hordei]|uniref:transcriptional regulator n=1 Tax=Liquorilactobacillus hordei TaxID=468911 RepID=UPI0039EB7DDF